jgi:drug/metabolite transporter (DMT)-like permease
MNSAQGSPRSRQAGLIFLLITSVGWGLNWPVIKLVLREWPPLFSRGSAGLAAALGLALIALLRRERLSIPRGVFRRLASAAALNVFAWMGFATLAMVWLKVSEGALLVYTMPIWAMLLAWPILGERPTAKGITALALGVAGVGVLLTARGGPAVGPDKLPGVLLALGAAILFAFGAAASRGRPLPLPPLAAVAWQVGLGCLPMVAAGLLFERPDPEALTPVGWAAMAYMAMVSMGLCYLGWFAALRRLPAATASMATLLAPLVGVVAAALTLGEPLGPREGLSLGLTLGGVALALRKP